MRAAGISDDAIDRRARNGHLIRKQKSVYAVGHAAPTPLTAETEALLACGPHAVLSHLTAARLLKLLPDTAATVHLTIRGRHGARPTGVHVHRTARLNRSEVRMVEDLPITSALRTLLDLAAVADIYTLERAIEEALHEKLVSVRQLRQATEGEQRPEGRREPQGDHRPAARARHHALERPSVGCGSDPARPAARADHQRADARGRRRLLLARARGSDRGPEPEVPLDRARRSNATPARPRA